MISRYFPNTRGGQRIDQTPRVKLAAELLMSQGRYPTVKAIAPLVKCSNTTASQALKYLIESGELVCDIPKPVNRGGAGNGRRLVVHDSQAARIHDLAAKVQADLAADPEKQK